jgi:nicotinamide mononucleotide transporter PnuC
LLLLIISIVLIFGSGFIYSSDWLTVLASFLGAFYALNQAKGKIFGQFIGIIEVVLYSWLSYKNQYYGEVIVYVLLVFPLHISGIYSWIKNEDKVTNKVIQNIIKLKEWLYIGITTLVLFISIYFILKHFNTSELLVSTLSVMTYLIATYLVVRRSKIGFLFYILSDIVILILWGIPVFNGNLLLIPILCEPIVLFANDIYGWIAWNKKKL